MNFISFNAKSLGKTLNITLPPRSRVLQTKQDSTESSQQTNKPPKTHLADHTSPSTYQTSPGHVKTGHRIAIFSEKVSKIMKNIQDAYRPFPLSEKPSRGKRKTDKFNEKFASKHPESEKKTKDVKFAESSTGNKFLLMADPTNSKAVAKRKFTVEERKVSGSAVLDEDPLASTTMLDPNATHKDFWYFSRAMWSITGEKDLLDANLRVVSECASEALAFTAFPTDHEAPLNGIRIRPGRSIKRRKRDVKVAAARRDSDSPTLLPLGTSPSMRKFIIPDVPYDVAEALSMDVIDAAFDFIHNG